MPRPLFTLSPRLSLCAGLCIPGLPLFDVGTDHGYLPVWMLKKGLAPYAVGGDLRSGPLASARENARRYRVEEKLALVEADGLSGMTLPKRANIVAAGMGGETILTILENAPALKTAEYRLVLQPMSGADALRRGLLRLGFALREERAVLDAGRPYTAMAAEYCENIPPTGEVFPYLGLLSPKEEAARVYAQKVLRDLSGRLEGALRGRGEEPAETLRAVMEAIRRDFLKDLLTKVK